MEHCNQFVIEQGVGIFEKPKIERSGKWKELASKMSDPIHVNGKVILDSVGHTEDGVGLTLKQAVSLTNALARQGRKGTTRKNGNGYRVWRIS